MTKLDEATFESLAEQHRREIHLHCYRMLGSLHDADDVTQDTLLRAWRHRKSYEGRSSVRAWLYAIATNACLTAIAKRGRRILPENVYPEADPASPAAPAAEVLWLEPYPDSLVDESADVEARIEQSESVSLAFVAALQYLPGRQRASLILRDVLGWHADEVAKLLDSSVGSVNSALQRARATLRERLPSERPDPERVDRVLLQRYVRAFEAADVKTIVSMLKRDALMSMPPYAAWYRGRDKIGRFLRDVVFVMRQDIRLELTSANGRPAFVVREKGAAIGVMSLAMAGGKIAEITAWPDEGVATAFVGAR